MDVNEAVLVVEVTFIEKLRSIESHYRAMIDMYSSPGVRDAIGLLRVLKKRDQEINEARLRREIDISRLRDRWSSECGGQAMAQEGAHEHVWRYGRAAVQMGDLAPRHADYRNCACGREEIIDPYSDSPLSWVDLGWEEIAVREVSFGARIDTYFNDCDCDVCRQGDSV